ncbi:MULTISPECIES: DUF4214 domain-containing protein [unclassified Chelatococcus]|uniref:DUF4214 domain-containing protein n=1 Tax=unclassified Chelatococcus TaxID=2638111 RepID=UPI001BCFAB66|nr:MULTISPECIES: DUF4214 domain-containing protein [unclassified Chelatococcus]CAH1656018.1 conserved hypothetical protein [Hyphomicrobiales bacterium]MBS7740470.1 DUF4214 domain-containing protein [Chelatococcus sp. HY11]MBX3544746.1 DUF4214 domain-containing protein [Chelatococcus sp.]MCO5078286.1 DUF4214 domain-containing protein [Chelatococcus sp.]CAH1684884.1 conserved hypothetical protein [Hyphomicrobiales bacterium]
MSIDVVLYDTTGSVAKEVLADLKTCYTRGLADWLALLPSPHPLNLKLTIVPRLEEAHIAETHGDGLKTMARREGVAGMRVMAHPAFKAITGFDNEPDEADIHVKIGLNSLENLSFDGAFDERHRFDATTVFRHEIAHALFMANALRPASGDISSWDGNIQFVDGAPRFMGSHARTLFPDGIPLDGKRAHVEEAFASRHHSALGPKAPENRALSLSSLDTAFMSDCGLPTALNDRMILGEWIHGTLNMGDGTDTVIIQATSDAYNISWTHDGLFLSLKTKYAPDGKPDQSFNPELTLLNTERIQFSDAMLAFDTEGNAGRAYRLCAAVYDDDPPDDMVFARLDALDKGGRYHELACDLVATERFATRFGAAHSSEDLIALFYQELLGRFPDTAGEIFWRESMQAGIGKEGLLGYFADCPEYKKITATGLGGVILIETAELL